MKRMKRIVIKIQNLDIEELTEHLIDNGLPHHRVTAFFKHATSHLNLESEEDSSSDGLEFVYDDDDEEEEGEDEDQYIRTKDGDIQDDYPYDYENDDDGLNELLQFKKSNKSFMDPLEIGTKTLHKKGKGSKAKLDLDHIQDTELKQNLLNQYLYRTSNKKKKKSDKGAKAEAAKLIGNDLLEKYPFVIHIWEMKDEFDEFLQDTNRNALRFPPLDPHGNKILSKLCECYNMLARKLGNPSVKYVVAVKNKRTYRKIPDYNAVSRMMKQRPVFHRKDVKRAPEEVASENKSRRKNGINKAHVIEGQVVGAEAPEIGKENIGHKLLEKLGWKKGDALGSDDNKGT
ncbi:unnamed protein product [[Candida] boidinii]|nr:unnamed protein product [[Candida] boidinii]